MLAQGRLGCPVLAVPVGADVFQLEALHLLLGHLHRHVRVDAVLVDVPVAGRQVLGDGHGHAGAVGKSAHRLHQTLAEGLLAHQHGPVVVLQGAGKDLAGARRTLIDQYHHRFGGQGLAGGPLDVLDPVAGLGGDNDAFVDPLAGDLDARHQQPAGVAAQVQHVALHALGLQVPHRRPHVLGGGGAELLQADVADLGAVGCGVHLVGDRVDLDQLPGEGGVEVLALAAQHQIHRRAGLATDELDRILGAHPFGALAVDRDDDVLGLHAGPGGR